MAFDLNGTAQEGYRHLLSLQIDIEDRAMRDDIAIPGRYDERVCRVVGDVEAGPPPLQPKMSLMPVIIDDDDAAGIQRDLRAVRQGKRTGFADAGRYLIGMLRIARRIQGMKADKDKGDQDARHRSQHHEPARLRFFGQHALPVGLAGRCQAGGTGSIPTRNHLIIYVCMPAISAVPISECLMILHVAGIAQPHEPGNSLLPDLLVRAPHIIGFNHQRGRSTRSSWVIALCMCHSTPLMLSPWSRAISL